MNNHLFKHLGAVAVSLGLFTACGSSPMKRVAHPGADAGPPSISEVLDLGALPLSESAPTESMHTDRVGTPGEWLAIVGKNLGHASRVLIGGRETKIRGHLAGGSILVKVPTGLSLESNDGVVVETPRGQTYAKLRLASYVLAADTDGDKVHIVRHSKKVAQEKPPFEEDIFEVGLRRAKFIALSPDHGVAYVIQTPKKKKKGDITISSSELKVIHLGGKGRPREVGSITIKLLSPPSGMVMRDDGILIVLGERDLMTVDARNPLNLKVLKQVGLGDVVEKVGIQRVFTDIELLEGGRYAVALEAYSNSLVVVDLKDLSEPVVVQIHRVVKGELPLCIGLERDATDSSSFYLLNGPNYRVGGEHLRSGANSLKDSAVGLYDSAMGDAPKKGATKEAKSEDKSFSRLTKFKLESGRLVLDNYRELPGDFLPLFAHSRRDGSVVISGVGGSAIEFSDIDVSLDGVKKALTLLKDTAQMGRILELRDGQEVKTLVRGMAVYFNLASSTEGRLLYSILRIGPKYFPPSIAVDWGIEVTDRGFQKVRSLSMGYLIPPYSYNVVVTQ